MKAVYFDGANGEVLRYAENSRPPGGRRARYREELIEAASMYYDDDSWKRPSRARQPTSN
jgi:hypothetical protein